MRATLLDFGQGSTAMHMSDALLSPAVGLSMWAAAAGTVAVAAKRLGRHADERLPATMSILGAFVFAAQMINFAIPGTGSSGHLTGGLLLAILLGPWAAFLTMTSILTVQALLFADGGLLALGCNAVNLGWIPCLVAYPFIYRPLAGAAPSRRRAAIAAAVAATAAVLMGALGVVVETTASGISALSFGAFAVLMLPIHAAIGIVEGTITAAVVDFVHRTHPDWIVPGPTRRLEPLWAGFGLAAALLAGVGSWYASSRPDGLEWSLERLGVGSPAAPTSSPVHELSAAIQSSVAVMPDYTLSTLAVESGSASAVVPPRVQTSAAGLMGVLATLGLIAAAGTAVRRWGRRHDPNPRSTPACDGERDAPCSIER